ncbi:MAG: cittilin family RiPP precursor [Thermomicrobiales bacterium]
MKRALLSLAALVGIARADRISQTYNYY